MRLSSDEVVGRDLVEPSPLAAEIVNSRVYTFLDGAPLEERRTRAVASRRYLDPATASDLGRLDDAAIARTIIALAHSLRLGVIAEGVETAAQQEFLESAGCHAYQGYFFSRPLPLAGFQAFLNEKCPQPSKTLREALSC